MRIYIDVVLFLNFFFDTVLLIGVDLLLKRNTKFYKLILGGIVGTLSTFLLFIHISSFTLFIIKIFISILMVLTTFTYNTLKYTFKNIMYFYIISIFLGGTLYLLNNQFAYKQEGLVFFHNGMSINLILIIILTPIIITIYVKQNHNIKNNYNNYYKIKIYINTHIIESTSYLDTGNKLLEPYTFKPVLLLNNKDPIFNKLKYILIPYNTISTEGFIKGYKVDKIHIEGVGDKTNIIIGIINHKIKIDGVDSIMSLNILEGK